MLTILLLEIKHHGHTVSEVRDISPYTPNKDQLKHESQMMIKTDLVELTELKNVKPIHLLFAIRNIFYGTCVTLTFEVFYGIYDYNM